jgi:hypothetical protein
VLAWLKDGFSREGKIFLYLEEEELLFANEGVDRWGEYIWAGHGRLPEAGEFGVFDHRETGYRGRSLAASL